MLISIRFEVSIFFSFFIVVRIDSLLFPEQLTSYGLVAKKPSVACSV